MQVDRHDMQAILSWSGGASPRAQPTIWLLTKRAANHTDAHFTTPSPRAPTPIVAEVEARR